MGDGRRDASEGDFEIEVAELSRSGTVRNSRSEGPARRRRLWRLAAVVGILAVVALVLTLDVFGLPNLQRLLPTPPPPLVLRPQAQGMNCLDDAAWSPQGTRLALLGDQHAPFCPANTSTQKAGLVIVFDGTSGRLLATLHPDDAVVRAIQKFAEHVTPAVTLPPAAQIAAAIDYQHLLWSPDGRRVALTFSLNFSSLGLNLFLPNGDPERLHGVLLLDATGAHPQVLLQAVGVYEGFVGAWDLKTGTSIAMPVASPPTFGMLPPAVAYQWQAGATPVAITPLTAAAPPPVPPLGPVGNLSGGSVFTIWQPGMVMGLPQLGPDGQATGVPWGYELSASFLAWSPDGHYLLDSVVPDGVLELPDTPPPTPDQLRTTGFDVVPRLPLRDAGLARALRAVHPSTPSNPVGMFLTWRPDGRVLAAYAPVNVFAVPPVTLYDCKTGRQLAAVLPPAVGNTSVTAALLGQTILLRWSPDGTHLLLYALALGQVVVWGPQQLPH